MSGSFYCEPGSWFPVLKTRGLDTGHGFVGVPADFSSRGLEHWGPKLCAHLGVETLVLLEQVHGTEIVEVADRLDARGLHVAGRGDALLCSRRRGNKIALGIRTADCLPILIISKEHVAVVHAGWRGLASGVLEGALGCFGNLSQTTVVMGPAAGESSYEVGPEVIDAFAGRSVHRNSSCGKYSLDLTRTAGSIARGLGVTRILSSGIDTILDRRFHSYRREGRGGGHNIGFLTVE